MKTDNIVAIILIPLITLLQIFVIKSSLREEYYRKCIVDTNFPVGDGFIPVKWLDNGEIKSVYIDDIFYDKNTNSQVVICVKDSDFKINNPSLYILLCILSVSLIFVEVLYLLITIQNN